MVKKTSKPKFKKSLKETDYLRKEVGLNLKNLDTFVMVRLYDLTDNSVVYSYPMQVDELFTEIEVCTTDPTLSRVYGDEYKDCQVQIVQTHLNGTRFTELFNDDLVEFYTFAEWERAQIRMGREKRGLHVKEV